MRVGSLFSGIGGFDLGLERAGHEVVFQCESDPYRRAVLRRHWPGVRCYEDVRDVQADAPGISGRARKSDSGANGSGRAYPSADAVDLLCGGFPCQDLSVAGRRAGLGGERSGLFFEFARVADAVLPDGGWLLIENVPGLLSSNGGRDFAVLLATLAELRFHDLAWRVLDSRYLGVPQRRRRVFILGRRSSGRRAAEVLLEPESGGGDFEAGREARTGVAGSVSDGARSARTLTGSERWDGDTEDFIANEFERTGAVGSLAGTKQRGGWRFGADEAAGGQLVAETSNLVAHTLRSEGFDASEDGTGRGTPIVPSSLELAGGRWDAETLQPTALDGRAGGDCDSDGEPGSSPHPDRMRTPPGSAGRVDDFEGAEPQLSVTLTASYATKWNGNAGAFNGSNFALEAGQRGSVTPLDPKPDGPRYAACGDAVTASVSYWIGRRLMDYERKAAA